jgi:hypothetical protein
MATLKRHWQDGKMEQLKQDLTALVKRIESVVERL